MRFILSALAVEVFMAMLIVTVLVAERRFTTLIQALNGVPLASLPLATLVAAFLSFFPLTRTYANRLLGYLTLFLLGMLIMGVPVVAIKLGWIRATANVPEFPASWDYSDIAIWYSGLSLKPLTDALAGIAAFALFVSSFWGFARMTKNRPLWGAFLAPTLGLVALLLFSSFLSGIADAVFAIVGMNPGRIWTVSLLSALASLCLIFLDFLVCPKTDAGRLHG